MPFATKDIKTWTEFTELLARHDREWLYRGQCSDWPLKTSLERALGSREIDFRYAPAIERDIIREFRRRYQGTASGLINTDTLHCLALMQHHGAPTRLLDWTYSPFVAAKFATETGGKEAVIWCLHGTWCEAAAAKIAGKRLIDRRGNDKFGNDGSFLPLYMKHNKGKPFALPENPLNLNQRMIVQQSKFLCPSDVRVPFIENLKMDGWRLAKNILKIRLKINRDHLKEFANVLGRMNVNSAVLFPGFDGFVKSLHEQLFHYETLAQRPGHRR